MLLAVLFFSGLAGAATLVGLGLTLWRTRWTEGHARYIISVAAGFTVALALVYLFPEALGLSKYAPLYAVGAFVAFFALEHGVVVHACRERDCVHRQRGLTAALGLGVHSLFDGVVIGVGFAVSSRVGLMTSLAVILHKVPEGVFTYTLLRHAAEPLGRAAAYTVIVALATPVGGIGTYFLISPFASPALVGALLAAAAGSFVYVAAADLLPEAHAGKGLMNVALLALGAAAALALGLLRS